MKIGYLVHDLGDAAVHRRVRMLQRFADVALIGFHRANQPQAPFADLQPVSLGRTRDARLAHRALAVLRAAVLGSEWQAQLTGATVVIARQLEMLALAALVRRRVVPDAPLVYECLDIHRLMLTPQPVGVALRAIEHRLLRACQLLVVSSPGFLANHFARYGAALPEYLLLENKVLDADVPPDVLQGIAQLRIAGPPPRPPWRIGWFGIIRCHRSLQLLANLVRQLPGTVEVIIRGRPKRNVIPEFDAVVASTPGLSFLGEYDRHADLARIYGEVHFTWAIDYYEAGSNSAWLLPNRLYEGALYGAVPLALDGVQTGRWLAERECGVRLQDTDVARDLGVYFAALDPAGYAAARQSLARQPLTTFLDDRAACDHLGSVLRALPRRQSV